LNRVLVSFLSNVLVRKIIFIIFQGCFTVQLSRFLESVLIPFAVRFTASANTILSNMFVLVNTFFQFF